MAHYRLSPEVAGGLGPDTELDTTEHPPTVHRLHYEFQGWLGDDLLETFPCFIATRRLCAALSASSLSGYELTELVVTKSEEFEEMYPGRELPAFQWLRLTGRPGIEDFGPAPDASLIASEAALQLFQTFTLDHCDIELWSPD
jgi:hypothetical protein